MPEIENTESEKRESDSSEPVFREKSLAHVTAWKYSHAYPKGSGPVVWMAGVAMLIIIVAVVIWTFLSSPYYLLSILTGGAIG